MLDDRSGWERRTCTHDKVGGWVGGWEKRRTSEVAEFEELALVVLQLAFEVLEDVGAGALFFGVALRLGQEFLVAAGDLWEVGGWGGEEEAV